ncbi:MAG: hypothetical protein R3224_07940, partial [Balneolaceae bacterium]|nr:hypothetical protein [Balneolaceae bacterium]
MYSETTGSSFGEFSQGDFFNRLPEDKQRRIFERLDSDGDGRITPEDKPMRRPRKDRQPEGGRMHPRDMFRHLDGDRD